MTYLDNEFKHKRILITGANGFIGSKLINYLEMNNYRQLFTLSRKLSKDIDQINVSHMSVDLQDGKEVNDAIQQIKPEVIFHLAADIRPSRDVTDLKEMINTNVIGTTNLLSSIVRNSLNIDCFINMGSCEEYGFNSQPFSEDMPASPVSMYSGTKAASTALVKMFFNLYNIPIVTVRPSLVYGPGQGKRFFIPQAVEKLLLKQELHMTHGEQTRDFIYIDDLIEGLVEISQSRELIGEVVNLSYGEDISLKKVVEILSEITKTNSEVKYGAIPYRDGEIMSFAVSNKKIVNYTTWRPRTPITVGLTNVVAQIKGELS